MKTVLIIFHSGKWQDFGGSDLPLAVGITSERDIVFGAQAEGDPAAGFEFNDQQVFLRSAKSSGLVRINGEQLTGSARLAAGDEIQIGDSKFFVKMDSGVTVISPAEGREEPVTVPTDPATIAPLPGKSIRSGLRNAIIIIFVFLLMGVGYVLSAASVRLAVTPAPDVLSLSGFPLTIKIGDNYLALPGRYDVTARKEGYRELKETIKVRFGSDATYALTLQKLPGLLHVVSVPVEGARVRLDDNDIGTTPLRAFEIEAGQYKLSIAAPRYLTATKTVDVEGMGVQQSVEITLEPDWGTLKVDSDPQGAEVWLNGKLAGPTPLTAEPVGGDHKMELRKDGWKSHFEDVTVEAGKITDLSIVKLQQVDGTLELTSDPAGARVLLNGEFIGNAPLSRAVESEKDHELSLSKNGFVTATRTARIEPDQVKKMNVQLEPEFGIVFIISKPADAQLYVDGRIIEGPASRRLRLTTLPHAIEIRKAGYQTHSTTLTPTAGVSKRIDALLVSDRQARVESQPSEIKTAGGQAMRRIFISKPVSFQMGASRRESGRRSNETQYMVELTRTFDISVKEVTNAEFRKFRREHNSGSEELFDLNEDDQPVASVAWDEAARYMNWLSDQEGLPAAYEEKDGKMIAVLPMMTGYRLPTEAEWAFATRYEGGVLAGGTPLKYPWGRDQNPAEKSGNYADESTGTFLPGIIKGYNDGYEVAAPVGQFPPNVLGLYDLGGNVSEWCHDYYDVQWQGQQNVIRDPAGPADGEYHVIRGASWRHGSITELRLTYRDYSDKSRNDVGFRIARYVE